MLRYLSIAWLIAAAGPALAMPSVEAAGLMRDMAILLIDGRQAVLRVGETSEEGVQLLAADAASATVKIAGRQVELALSRRVGTDYALPAGRSVHVNRDAHGQFRVMGSINEQPVRFLIDTGATLLAMSSVQATRLGIDYRSGEPGQVTTASGVTTAWFLTLDRVGVGDIEVEAVRTAIVDGQFPAEALLGMSFLRHVGFAENDGILTLLQRF